MPHLLRVKVVDMGSRPELLNYYHELASKNDEREDAGIDIPFPDDIDLPVNQVTLCKLGVMCEMILEGGNTSHAFYLHPRSSIGKTPCMMANSTGIIDAGYRGEIGAMIRCDYDDRFPDVNYTHVYKIRKGERLFQVTAPDLGIIHVEVLMEDDQLSQSRRGAQGFGSTGV